MKPAAAVVSVAVLFFIIGPILGQSTELVGTWEVVSGKWTTPDGSSGERNPAADPEDKGRSIKIINATHLATVAHTNKDGSFRHVSAGSYTVSGDTLVVKLTHTSIPDTVGYENKGKFKIEGDVLTWRYTARNGNKIEETWRRVKTP